MSDVAFHTTPPIGGPSCSTCNDVQENYYVCRQFLLNTILLEKLDNVSEVGAKVFATKWRENGATSEPRLTSIGS